MAWIKEMKIMLGRTIFSEGKGNGKAEREMTVSFTPGELLTTDSDSIRKYCREMSELCKCSIDEAIGTSSEPREPAKGGAPQTPASTSEPEKATDKQLDLIRRLLSEKKVNGQELLTHYEVQDITQLTKDKASGAIKLLKEKK